MENVVALAGMMPNQNLQPRKIWLGARWVRLTTSMGISLTKVKLSVFQHQWTGLYISWSSWWRQRLIKWIWPTN